VTSGFIAQLTTLYESRSCNNCCNKHEWETQWTSVS